MTGLFALAAALAVASHALTSGDDAGCTVRVNQPAAWVWLNRPDGASYPLCIGGCAADLVGARRESGLLSGLAIYNGRSCP